MVSKAKKVKASLFNEKLHAFFTACDKRFDLVQETSYYSICKMTLNYIDTQTTHIGLIT